MRTSALFASFFLLLSFCAWGEFPWKASDGDASDPYAYEKYLYITPSQYPPSDISDYLYMMSSKTAGGLYGTSDPRYNPLIEANPQELYGVTGDSTDRAWEITTGRPDVVVGVTDSGIRWNDWGRMQDLRKKVRINPRELPLPKRADGTGDGYDLNRDGVVNIDDYAADSRVSDANRSGFLDPEDLIFIFSDGIDGDANGYTDDIAGWDFYEEDNDPYDETQFGHGSGQAQGSTGEAMNGGEVGMAPNCMVVPLRVGDSFIADITHFAEAVVYAADNNMALVQCALGVLNNSRFAQEAIDYAYRRGVLVVSSAADEEASHHNLPSILEHTVTLNSVGQPELPEMETLQPSYLEWRGCTNYGAFVTACVPSDSCSSEATARCTGLAGLAFSGARNAVKKGIIQDYGKLDGAGGIPEGWALSAEEVHQLIATTAEDINFMTPVDYTLRPFPETRRLPATEGWDPFFGYGRVNAYRMQKAILEDKIPPEVYVDSPRFFETVSPRAGAVRIEGGVAARRAAKYSYTVKWAAWSWRDTNTKPRYTTAGVTLAATGDQTAPIHGLIATIDPGAIAAALATVNGPVGATNGPAVDPVTGRADLQSRAIPDKFSIILRVEVVAKDAYGQPEQDIDGYPLTGLLTKDFYFHDDPSLFPGYPDYLASGGSPRFADLDNDGVEELIMATSNGEIHATKADGTEVPGWPVRTTDAGVPYSAPGYRSGEITVPIHSPVLFGATVGDLFRDGNLAVVAGDIKGRIWAFDRRGRVLPGFPVRSNPAYSAPQRSDREAGYYAAHPELSPGDFPGGTLPNSPDRVPDLVNRKDKLNSVNWWFYASPTLANIDPSDEALEIVAGAGDRHLYAFKANGQPLPGWPVLLRDPTTLAAVHPATHRLTYAPGVRADRGGMIVTSAAAGDLDGDGKLEIVSTVNEQYYEPINSDDPVMPTVLAALDEEPGNNRVYAIYADGSLHNGGPSGGVHPHANAYLPGWPAKVGTLLVALLPVIGEGPNGAPVLGDVNQDGRLDVGIFGTLGPAYVFDGNGVSIFGRDDQGRDRSLLMQPSGALSNSLDLPSIPALGGGIFADVLGTGTLSFATGAAGLGKFLDVSLNEDQLLSDNHLSVWDLSGTRTLLPAFPREVNDLHIFSIPACADIDGDGLEEVLDGTAYSDLHAINALGVEPGQRLLSPDGWPKFTGGWSAGSAAVGDFDGDGYRDVAATTRDGYLFVWRANGAKDADPATWPQWGHDNWNTNNVETDAVRPGVITDLSVETRDAQMTVVGAKVDGGGWIPVGLSRGNLGFNVGLANGAVDGKLKYDDKNLGGVRVKSSAVTNVTMTANGVNPVLHWTAPGDDAYHGRAARYSIRRSTSPITADNWKQATEVPNTLVPQEAGAPESFVVTGVNAGRYYFAVLAYDEAGNVSPASNSASGTVSEPTSTEATFQGSCTINGAAGHSFTVIVQDNGEPGAGADTFSIRLDTGYVAYGYLGGGNVEIEVTDVEEQAEAVATAPPSSEIQSQWQWLFGLDGLTFLLQLF